MQDEGVDNGQGELFGIDVLALMTEDERHFRINRQWSLKETFENASARYNPCSQAGGPARIRSVQSWGQLVGRTKALAEFDELLSECGSITGMARTLRSTIGSLRNLRNFFQGLPDDRAQAIRQQFQAQRPALESFRTRLTRLIEELLEASDLKVNSIESRVKDIDSFTDKACSPRKNYVNPLAEITDQVGVRIIAVYLEDVERICELIQREFTVDMEKSGDKRTLLKVDQVGYQSVHFVLTIKTERASQLEWKSCLGLWAEVQVRTVLQHAWAQIEHQLNYKTTSTLSNAVKRQLYNLSALLEIGDREFSRLRLKSEEEVAAYKKEIPERNYDFEVNQESLSNFLYANRMVGELVGLGAQFGLVEPYTRHDDEEDSYLESICEACEFLNLIQLRNLDAVLEVVTADPLFAETPQRHLGYYSPTLWAPCRREYT